MNTLHEVVALRPGAVLPPGIAAMQIAADRWLVPDWQPSLPEGFAVTDVTGKWREMRTTAELLSNTVDVEALLADHDCARTALFDCPAIVRKLDQGYSVWIERSYEHAFNAALRQAAAL
jgi:hypothetical protein